MLIHEVVLYDNDGRHAGQFFARSYQTAVELAALMGGRGETYEIWALAQPQPFVRTAIVASGTVGDESLQVVA